MIIVDYDPDLYHNVPADSPKRVTFLGFPPNAAILLWTHASAAR